MDKDEGNRDSLRPPDRTFAPRSALDTEEDAGSQRVTGAARLERFPSARATSSDEPVASTSPRNAILSQMEADALAKSCAHLGRQGAHAVAGAPREKSRKALTMAPARTTRVMPSSDSTLTASVSTPSDDISNADKLATLRAMEDDVMTKERALGGGAVATRRVRNANEPGALTSMRDLEDNLLSKSGTPPDAGDFNSAISRDYAEEAPQGEYMDYAQAGNDIAVEEGPDDTPPDPSFPDPSSSAHHEVPRNTRESSSMSGDHSSPSDEVARSGIEAFVSEPQVINATAVAPIMSEEEEEKLEERKYRRLLCYGGALFVLVVGIVVGVVVVLAQRGGEEGTIMPTTIMSMQPSTTPSMAPTTTRFFNMQQFLAPRSGGEILSDMTSPQHQALVWVSNEDPLNLPIGDPRLVQRYALAAIYFALGGDMWTKCGRSDISCSGTEQRWLFGSVSECTYLGVTCDDRGDVVSIIPSFRGNGLEGTLPLELSFLTSLAAIVMPNDKIYGPLPEFLGDLVNLTTIILTENSLTGALPATALLKLTQLETFHLSGNLLNGTIPTELGVAPFKDLRLDSNDFEGTIPTGVGAVSTLALAEFEHNRFSGTLPIDLLSNPFIKELRLENNSFVGPIPTTVGMMSNLDYLSLSDNPINSTIPTELFSLRSLSRLDLHATGLKGTLSEDFVRLNSTLRRLILNNNRLTGSIPQAFEQLTRLHELLLHTNPLTGTISQALCALKGVTFFEISNLTAPPSVLCDCCDFQL